MCGPVYAFHCRHADEQRAVRSHPFRDQCESAWWTISSQTKAANREEEYLRRAF